MKNFLSEDFLLHSNTAKILYNEYAKDMPIYDYHCHLPVKDIAENINFKNISQIWLYGDHYKWRAMRANGVNEHYITGKASDWEKFKAWADTVPKTLCNPLYHWTHLELKRYFGINSKFLCPETADEIYKTCNKLLQTQSFSTHELMKKMNVKVAFTTDDPTDTLASHRKIQMDSDFNIRILPTFHPDKAIAIESPTAFNQWITCLEQIADIPIKNYDDFLEALRNRHDFFHEMGCRLSDHGVEQPYVDDFTANDIIRIFKEIRQNRILAPGDIRKFKSAVLLELARMDSDKNWTQQFHLGALRNTNTKALKLLGPDTGYDSIGDFEIAKPLAKFLDLLNIENKLAKTILYVVNPRDNELIASMIGNFQDSTAPGKIQFGSGWWFNDQKDGIQRQIGALSNMGLLSRFIGMLTDSRSFLSYPRHEYFRRVLSNLLGNDVENGELPNNLDLIGDMIKDICYRNAVNYFGIKID